MLRITAAEAGSAAAEPEQGKRTDAAAADFLASTRKLACRQAKSKQEIKPAASPTFERFFFSKNE